MENITFEQLSDNHAEKVMKIYNYYIQNSFAAYLESVLPVPFFQRFLELTKGYPAYAILCNGEVVGFCFIRAYNPLPAFNQTAEITYFIDSEYVGRGIGALALNRLEDDAVKMGISTLLASITSRNEQSLAFHKKHGFVEYGLFPEIGRKFNQSFGIVWMGKKL